MTEPPAVTRVRPTPCCGSEMTWKSGTADSTSVRGRCPPPPRGRSLISRPCEATSVDKHRGIKRKTPVSGRFDCDRTVIRQARNLEEHRGLRMHIKESVWRGKSLIACALTRFEVGQCGSPASSNHSRSFLRCSHTTTCGLRLTRRSDAAAQSHFCAYIKSISLGSAPTNRLRQAF
jgi:hypothetical protein